MKRNVYRSRRIPYRWRIWELHDAIKLSKRISILDLFQSVLVIISDHDLRVHQILKTTSFCEYHHASSGNTMAVPVPVCLSFSWGTSDI